MFTGADSVVLDRGDYTTCTINRQGATVTSWRVRNIELLFLSRISRLYKFDTIRGGISMVFPYLGPSDKGMQHGFSRVTQWDIEERPKYDKAGNAYVTMSLTHNHWTESLWGFKFKIYYTVILMESTLQFNICVENLSPAFPLRFTYLQHAYLKVQVLSTDRMYHDVEKHLYITNVMDEGLFKITRDFQMPSFCLWNPWSDRVKDLPNLEADEYKFFICAESGDNNVIRVEPKSNWKASQIIEYISTKYQEECNFNFLDLFKGYC
nr:unnamed protein product [Callosobruchus chinensis]